MQKQNMKDLFIYYKNFIHKYKKEFQNIIIYYKNKKKK